MNGYGYGANMFNPYLNMGIPYSSAPVQSQIVKVNGANGANAYNLAPNSTALLLDESASIVWLVQTDGAGYKTVSAYDIAPHVSQQEQAAQNLEMRVKRLEELINEQSHLSGNAGGDDKKRAEQPENKQPSAAV